MAASSPLKPDSVSRAAGSAIWAARDIRRLVSGSFRGQAGAFAGMLRCGTIFGRMAETCLCFMFDAARRPQDDDRRGYVAPVEHCSRGSCGPGRAKGTLSEDRIRLMAGSRVDLYAAIRRDARTGMSNRALQRKHGVGYRTVAAALESAWPKAVKHRV